MASWYPCVRRIPLVLALLFVAACHYDDDDDDFHDDDDDFGHEEPLTFIEWEDSINGDIVIDATDDAFRFRADTAELHYGSTTYVNVYVTDDSFLVADDEIIGSIDLVASEIGDPIAAMVGNDGFFLDFYGPESDLQWRNTDVAPIPPWTSFAGQSVAPEGTAQSTEETIVHGLGLGLSPNATPGGGALGEGRVRHE